VDLVALLAIQVLYAIASLALISIGLAIIFGMMRVINLAHGEFLMLGGYAAIVATNHGISIWLAMLVIAPIVVGLIGIIVERTIIRFLYGRMIDTMLATWGLSLFLVGLTTAIFGNTTVGISAPLGSIEIGAYRTSAYTLFVIVVAIVVLVLEAENAIQRYRDVIGATDPSKAAEGTIRKLYGTDVGENAVHGSDSPETAQAEVSYFFAGYELNPIA